MSSADGWQIHSSLPGTTILEQSRKKERRQKLAISDKRWDWVQILQALKRIIKAYYEQVYASKFNILGEMDTFLKKCELPKLTWNREPDRLILSLETEFATKTCPQRPRWLHWWILLNV